VDQTSLSHQGATSTSKPPHNHSLQELHPHQGTCHLAQQRHLAQHQHHLRCGHQHLMRQHQCHQSSGRKILSRNR
jgi:hypothetical protein